MAAPQARRSESYRRFQEGMDYERGRAMGTIVQYNFVYDLFRHVSARLTNEQNPSYTLRAPDQYGRLPDALEDLLGLQEHRSAKTKITEYFLDCPIPAAHILDRIPTIFSVYEYFLKELYLEMKDNIPEAALGVFNRVVNYPIDTLQLPDNHSVLTLQHGNTTFEIATTQPEWVLWHSFTYGLRCVFAHGGPNDTARGNRTGGVWDPDFRQPLLRLIARQSSQAPRDGPHEHFLRDMQYLLELCQPRFQYGRLQEMLLANTSPDLNERTSYGVQLWLPRLLWSLASSIMTKVANAHPNSFAGPQPR